jgi:phage-related protein
MKWQIDYYNEKVEIKVLELPKKLLARYFKMTDLMIEHGPDLGMPHTRSLGGGLLEIRLKASEGIARVFYCSKINKKIMMLHSFVKKTEETPKKELKIARSRLDEVLKND